MTTSPRVDLSRVAEIAFASIAEGRGHVAAVRDELGVSGSTATRYIAAARAEGLLPSKEATASATRNPKAAAVAEALGVTYEALVAAVIEHADSDLRILGARHRRQED
ncbi:hypothetical protein [Agrococcus sp. DT81.2]|uniref:hypothetical protein n=1 Tax=Agrococcus sp. DT81.2 TaxID=3393414 RepID=UPI003CE4DA5F